MTWPTTSIPTGNSDAGTDSPAAARADILQLMQQVNQMQAHVSAFAATLLDDADPPAARATLGTDIYKSVPGNAALTAGEMFKATAGFTLNTGAAEGTTYTIYNNSASVITITQGGGLTLRLAGSTATGNRSLAARGIATVWCLSTTEYIISGVGVY